MQIRFLLGPAGSGKTFRCLAEIRQALRESPDGPPLILLAPKQATFQLERQLLADPAIQGFTRLHIVSFERLARFVLAQVNHGEPELLAEEGRIMVLRALLETHRDELQVFRATARLPGFARQLSQLLREFQQSHVTPDGLDQLATRLSSGGRLASKLRDLSLLARAYGGWLKDNGLEDADALLDLAALAIRNSPAAVIESVWVDGFAQMTPQEHALLNAVVMKSCRATLAFCLDSHLSEEPPWHSPWASVAETFLRCRDGFRSFKEADVAVEILPRDPVRSRFANAPVLRQLEQHWTSPQVFPENPAPESRSALRLVCCETPEAEAEFAAREIRRHVRERGGRFRDVAVLLRRLESHHHVIRQVFNRYEVPFFLDRRESVSHHPLAELTRYALRMAAFGWEHDDWFGALKTGLVSRAEGDLDWLENEAIARGWRGVGFWSQPIRIKAPDAIVARLESIRQRTTPAFIRMTADLALQGRAVSGPSLVGSVRALWASLGVDRQLQEWSDSAQRDGTLPNPRMHQTVWEQMVTWLENLQRAFKEHAFALVDWLPIVESGLANLTVGVVPPALDQVLVGAIDRSRNPDLQLVFVLGMNEGLFPAPPPAPNLLSHAERDTLMEHRLRLGTTFLKQIGMERYYAYIACTRSSRELVLTCAQRDSGGHELNPSLHVAEMRRKFPWLEVHDFAGVSKLFEQTPVGVVPAVEHWSEAVVAMLQAGMTSENDAFLAASGQPWEKCIPPEARQRIAALSNYRPHEERLPTDLIDRIHGAELRTSVSALEDYAACPFRFFVGHGLRASERVEFEIDAREKGSFQHEILQEFHLRLSRSGRRWRDVSPSEARAMIRDIGETLMNQFKEGLFTAAQARRFTGRMLIEGLERLVETLIAWNRQYQFDPALVELGFGLHESLLPGWRIDLDGRHALVLRGRIDRVDLCQIPETGDTLAVVIDYKSSQRELDNVMLDHGLQLQLLAYLAALEQFQSLDQLNAARLIPAGAFYVALNGGMQSAQNRDEERARRDLARNAASQHRGRFDGGYLPFFDGSGRDKGDQFRFSLKKNGEFKRSANEALDSGEFQALVRRVEDFLRKHGQEIYGGNTRIAPFRYRAQIACTYCDYQPVCRFDPWTQPFRVLRPLDS